MWHLRSGLNVAVLLCQGPNNVAMVASYNKMINNHKSLLAAAAQSEVDLYKSKGGKKWQDAFDDHMTKIYNAYSGTLTRDAFCSTTTALLTELETATPVAFSDRSTAMLWEMNKAAGLPDPDGAIARMAALNAPPPPPPAPPKPAVKPVAKKPVAKKK